MNIKKREQSQLKERRKNIRSTGSEEKRGYIRTEVSVPMTLHIEKKGVIERVKARTSDVSASGMMIELGQQIPIGSQVKIDIEPQGSSNPIHCIGKVVRFMPTDKDGKYVCGVEFLTIEEDNKNSFLKFLCDVIYKSSSGE